MVPHVINNNGQMQYIWGHNNFPIRGSGNYTLEIGFRPGWPGSFAARFLTHAVFRFREKGTMNVTPWFGYGKPPRQAGQVVVDNTGVAPTTVGTINLEGGALISFLTRMEQECPRVLYTGIGANCYTPIMRSLEDVLQYVRDLQAVRASIGRSRGMLIRGNERETIEGVRDTLQTIMGHNLSMGMSITNTKLLLIIIIAVAYYFNLLHFILRARGEKKDDPSPPPDGAAPAVPSGPTSSQQGQLQKHVVEEVSSIPPKQQTARANTGNSTTIASFTGSTLTEQLKSTVWKEVVKISLRELCNNDENMQKKVDQRVGEFFLKEKEAGRQPKLSTIQAMITKEVEKLESKKRLENEGDQAPSRTIGIKA